MPVFTVLEVKAFSGYYPSCQLCLRRLTVLKATGKNHGQIYECGQCCLVYKEDEVVYRYCLTTTAQSGRGCHNVVVFGECLNQVFGAPATELQRILLSWFPDSLSMVSPFGLHQLLLEPLQSILSGRCFTANLTLSRKAHSKKGSSDPRYIASRFRLLGDLGNLSVVFLLEQLRGYPVVDVSNQESNRYSGHKEKPKSEEKDMSVGAVSLLCSPLTAVHVTPSQSALDFQSLSHASSTSRTPFSLLPPVVHGEMSQGVSFPSTASPTAVATQFSPLSHKNKAKSCSNDSESEANLDLVMMCDELVGELISVWESFSSQPVSPCDGSRLSTADSGIAPPALTNASNIYDETLPDSESFLAELQCDFEPSLLHSECVNPSSPLRECSTNTLSVPHCSIASSLSSDCLHLTPTDSCVPGHSPELFTGSNKRLCDSSAADENHSPELFSSPSAASPAPVLGTSSVSACSTPAMSRGLGKNPRRNILKGSDSQSSRTPRLSGLVTHSAYSGGDPLTGRSKSSFSPELFF